MGNYQPIKTENYILFVNTPYTKYYYALCNLPQEKLGGAEVQLQLRGELTSSCSHQLILAPNLKCKDLWEGFGTGGMAYSTVYILQYVQYFCRHTVALSQYNILFWHHFLAAFVSTPSRFGMLSRPCLRLTFRLLGYPLLQTQSLLSSGTVRVKPQLRAR